MLAPFLFLFTGFTVAQHAKIDDSELIRGKAYSVSSSKFNRQKRLESSISRKLLAGISKGASGNGQSPPPKLGGPGKDCGSPPKSEGPPPKLEGPPPKCSPQPCPAKTMLVPTKQPTCSAPTVGSPPATYPYAPPAAPTQEASVPTGTPNAYPYGSPSAPTLGIDVPTNGPTSYPASWM